jgi:hypothetical protein
MGKFYPFENSFNLGESLPISREVPKLSSVSEESILILLEGETNLWSGLQSPSPLRRGIHPKIRYSL